MFCKDVGFSLAQDRKPLEAGFRAADWRNLAVVSWGHDNPAKSILQAREMEKFPDGHTEVERRWWRPDLNPGPLALTLLYLLEEFSSKFFSCKFVFYVCLLHPISGLYIVCLLGSCSVLSLYCFTPTKSGYSLPVVCTVPEIVLGGVREVENRVSTLKKFIDKL